MGQYAHDRCGILELCDIRTGVVMLTTLHISIVPATFAKVPPNLVTGAGEFRSNVDLGAHRCPTMPDMLSAPVDCFVKR